MSEAERPQSPAGSPVSPAAALVKTGLGVAAVGVLLFLCAGSFAWIWGWAYLAVAAASSLIHTAWLSRNSPDLLRKRSSRGYREPGTPRWDTVISLLGGGLLPMASWIVSALDERYRWAPEVPTEVHLLGGVGLVLGWTIWLWAMFSNRFFASTVRLQDGHKVVEIGPYRYLRHPGYVGLVMSQVAAPALLGSWLGLAVALLTVPLLALRTALEDRWLHDQLPGYREYASRVRHRLLPGIW